MQRFARQLRLREIGVEGQARLAATRHAVPAGPGALVERAYLERAGVDVVPAGGSEPVSALGHSDGSEPLSALGHSEARASRAFSHAALFQHAASRDFAAGAWRAARVVVEALGLERA